MANRVEELRAERARVEKEMEELERAGRAAQSAAWEQLVKDQESWEWCAQAETRTAFLSGEKLVGARVLKRVKPERLAKWREGGFSLFSSDFQEEGRWFGMFYYRTEEGILTHEGGGHLVLNDPKLCDDEEWGEILAGRPPRKFLRG